MCVCVCVCAPDLDHFIMHTRAPWAAVDQALQQSLEVGQLDQEILAAQCPHAGGLTALFLLLHSQQGCVSCRRQAVGHDQAQAGWQSAAEQCCLLCQAIRDALLLCLLLLLSELE